MSEHVSDTRAQIVASICARIAEGESVRAVFRERCEGYPTEQTFWRWIAADDEVRKQFDAAQRTRSEVYAERITDIDDAEPEYTQTQFGQRIDPGWVALQKQKADNLKWIAARLLPKKYGDRTILAGDADNPLTIADAAIAGKLLPELAAGDAPATPGEPDDGGS